MKFMTLGLADVSHMSIFNDFDETDRNEFHGRIIDQFSTITVDSVPPDHHECTLGTGTNDLGNDTKAHTTLYSGQVEGASGLFGNSIDAGNIAANISGSYYDHIYSVDYELLSNCDHRSCVDDELLSNCDTKESVEDETNSNCDTKEKVDDETSSNYDTCLVEDESVRMGGENSTPLDVTNHDHTCQPLGLGNDFCDIDSVLDSILEDMVSCSLSNKPSEFQKIWSILSDSLCYVAKNMPTCMTYIPSWGYHFKKWKAKQSLYDAAKCNTPCTDNNDKYYGKQHGLKKEWFNMSIFPVDVKSLYIWIFSRQDTLLYLV